MRLEKKFRNVSISHATMIAEDVANAMNSFIEENGTEDMKAEWSSLFEDFSSEPENSKARTIILNEDMWDFFNKIAPNGCIFGASEGDGSDYGFWYTRNENEKIADLRDDEGRLPAYAWPGGYPIVYLDEENNLLCRNCAAENDEFSSPLDDYLVIEDPDETVYCDHCDKNINGE